MYTMRSLFQSLSEGLFISYETLYPYWWYALLWFGFSPSLRDCLFLTYGDLTQHIDYAEVSVPL